MILFDMDPGKPVLPVNLLVFELSFGTKIIDVEYEHSTPEIIDLPAKIAFAKASYDSIQYYLLENKMDVNVYENDGPYPSDWVSYRTGGGLSQDEHVTFLVLRVCMAVTGRKKSNIILKQPLKNGVLNMYFLLEV
jgi:hypothetical protein